MMIEIDRNERRLKVMRVNCGDVDIELLHRFPTERPTWAVPMR